MPQTDRDQDVMNPKASLLVAILDRATGSMKDQNQGTAQPGKGGSHPDWDAHCSAYFRAVMRQMGKHVPVPSELTDERHNATRLMASIQENRALWENIDYSQAQTCANGGALVVGVAPPPPQQSHSHLAFVIPTTLRITRNHNAERHPLVRDGNEHRSKLHLFPSTWGAVQSQYAFDAKAPPSWYAYRPWSDLKP